MSNVRGCISLMNNTQNNQIKEIIFSNSKQIYAYGTQITPEKTLAEIRKLLKKHGCKGWANIESPDSDAQIIQFVIPTKEFGDLPVQFTPKKVILKSRKGSRYLENESFRLLYLEIKTRLLLSKYSSLLESFLSNVLTMNNIKFIDMVKNNPKYLALPENIESKGD